MESNNLHEIADEITRIYGKQLGYDCMKKRMNDEELRSRIEGEFQRDYTRIPVLVDGIDIFDCTVKYRTEENEFIKYNMTIDFPNMIDRKDTVYIKKLFKYRQSSHHNICLSKSISSNELLSKVSNLNLD